jgi:hypothetical protein
MRISLPATAMFMLILTFAPLGATSAQTTNDTPSQESSTSKGNFKITEINVIQVTHYYGTAAGFKYVGLFQNSDGQQRKYQFVLYPTMKDAKGNVTVAVDFDQSALCVHALPCAVFRSDYSTNALTQQATEALRQDSERQQVREAMLKFQKWAAIASRDHVTSVWKTISDFFDESVDNQIWFRVDADGNASFVCRQRSGDLLDAQFYLYLLDSGKLERGAEQFADSQRKAIAKQNMFK